MNEVGRKAARRPHTRAAFKEYRKSFPHGAGMDDGDDQMAFAGFYECWRKFRPCKHKWVGERRETTLCVRCGEWLELGG